MPSNPPTPPTPTRSPANDDPDARLKAERAGTKNPEYMGSAPLAPLKTTTTTDSHGNEIEVQAGADGKTPISPQNPSPRAVSNPDNFETPPNES